MPKKTVAHIYMRVATVEAEEGEVIHSGLNLNVVSTGMSVEESKILLRANEIVARSMKDRLLTRKHALALLTRETEVATDRKFLVLPVDTRMQAPAIDEPDLAASQTILFIEPHEVYVKALTNKIETEIPNTKCLGYHELDFEEIEGLIREELVPEKLKLLIIGYHFRDAAGNWGYMASADMCNVVRSFFPDLPIIVVWTAISSDYADLKQNFPCTGVHHFNQDFQLPSELVDLVKTLLVR